METTMDVVEKLLLPGEVVLMTVRQSYFASLAPARIFVTDRRMIMVHTSFWGLYTGINISATTKVSLVDNRNILAVSLTKGVVLSSIEVGLQVQTATTHAEWSVEGMRHSTAEILTNFIHDLLEGRGRENVSEFTLGEAKEVVERMGSKFVWVGVQDARRVMDIMKLEPEGLEKLKPSDLADVSKAQLEHLKDCVLVDYNGSVAMSMARWLKKEKGIEVYVLKGGIASIKEDRVGHMLTIIKNDIKGTDDWTLHNAPYIGRAAEVAFGIIWGINALLKLPLQSFAASIVATISAAGTGQSQWYQNWVVAWAAMVSTNPIAFASAVVGIELLISVCLVLGLLRKPIYIVGILYSLLIWSVPNGLGGPYGNPVAPTNIGVGIVYAFVFVFVALISAMYGNNKFTFDRILEKRVGWWGLIAEIRHPQIFPYPRRID